MPVPVTVELNACPVPSSPPETAPPIAAAPTEITAESGDDSSASAPSNVTVPALTSPVEGSTRTLLKVTPTVSSLVV